jgi:lauroyl/myristoyl acyltransferase
MNPIALVTGRHGPTFARALCRLLPRRLAYGVGWRLAERVASRDDLPLIQRLRANHAVIYGLPVDHPRVAESVSRLLQNTVTSSVDLFKALDDGPEAIRASCHLDQSVHEIIQNRIATGRGMVLVSAHTCSFDMAMLYFCQLFPSVQALSNPDPRGSSRDMNNIRLRHGLDITPISRAALRKALQRLRHGGLVAIAGDIPVEGSTGLEFFGRPARLPVGHARLAMKSGAAVMVGISRRTGQGRYSLQGSLSPRPPSSGDRSRDAICWAQSSLAILEGHIRLAPEEWLMPRQVWIGANHAPLGESVSNGRGA